MEGRPVEAAGVVEGSWVAERGISDPFPMVTHNERVDTIGVFPEEKILS